MKKFHICFFNLRISQLYYLRARFYSPAIARFIQEDTYYGDGLNLYAYCHNNPVMYVDPSGNDAVCPAAYKKYRNEGFTAVEAGIKAKYDEIYKKSGERKASSYLESQLNHLRKNGYEFSDRWNRNNILNKLISEWTNADLQRAVDSIHNAQYGGRLSGKFNPITITVSTDGRIIVSKNNGVVGPKSRNKAKEILGEGVEFVRGGKSSNYKGNVDGCNHSEARGIQYMLNNGIDPTDAKQAITHYSCDKCEKNKIYIK